MKRYSVNFNVDKKHGTNSLHPVFNLLTPPKTWSADIGLAMLQIGILTSPPRYTGLSLSNFWAFLRYLPAIDRQRVRLKLCDVWDEIDSHQKTIMSDDFGMAFPSLYLMQKVGYSAFADCRWVLEKAMPGYLKSKSAKKNGPAKAPDFICIDGSNKLHVLECKGTQDSIAKLSKAIAKGVTQKHAVGSPSGVFDSRMVGGLFFPQRKSRQDALLEFADPSEDEVWKKLQDRGEKYIHRVARRVSLSKTLASAGLWRLATTVFDGHVNQRDRDFVTSANGELDFTGFAPGDESFRLNVEHRSFEKVEGNIERPIRNRLSIEVDRKFNLELGKLISSNALNDLYFDEWLEDKYLSRRRSIPAEKGDEMLEVNPEASSHGAETSDNIASIPDEYLQSSMAWTCTDIASELVTPFGVKFSLSALPYE